MEWYKKKCPDSFKWRYTLYVRVMSTGDVELVNKGRLIKSTPRPVVIHFEGTHVWTITDLWSGTFLHHRHDERQYYTIEQAKLALPYIFARIIENRQSTDYLNNYSIRDAMYNRAIRLWTIPFFNRNICKLIFNHPRTQTFSDYLNGKVIGIADCLPKEQRKILEKNGSVTLFNWNDVKDMSARKRNTLKHFLYQATAGAFAN